MAPWFLKPVEPLFCFHLVVLNSAPGTSTSVGEISQDYHCHTQSRSPADESHNNVCTNLTREKGKDTRVSRPPGGLAESPLP